MNLSFIKLDINIMNDTKIKIIRKMPDGDKMIVLWVGILCLGMKSGKAGVLEIGDGIPFTSESLSAELDIPVNTVKLGLETFKSLRMVELFENNTIYISNFEKHQELDKIEMAKEKTRLRVQKSRDKKKLMIGCNDDVTVTVTECNATDKDKDKDKDKEIDIDKEQDFNTFWNMYDYKINKPQSIKLFNKLKKEDIDNIISYLPLYIKNTPNKKYRKHPTTFLNNRSWEDEIVNKTTPEYDKTQNLFARYNPTAEEIPLIKAIINNRKLTTDSEIQSWSSVIMSEVRSKH